MIADQYIEQISDKCRDHDVKALYLIGSVARGENSAESDLDFVVNFNNLDQPGIADRFFDFKSFLESLFAIKIDLIEETAIQNPYFKQAIERDKILIF